MKSVFIILLILSVTNLMAQTISVYSNSKGQKVTRIDTQTNQGGHSVTEYKGSMFLNDDYVLGKFETNGGLIMEAPILYNIANGMVTAKINDNFVVIANVNFSIGTQSFMPIKGENYEVLLDGFWAKDAVEKKSVRVLRKYSCSLKKNENIGYQVPSDFDGEFLRSMIYYIQFSNGELKTFEINKKSIKKLLIKEKWATEKELDEQLPDIKSIDDVLKWLQG